MMNSEDLVGLIKQHRATKNGKSKHLFQQRRHGEEEWVDVLDPSWNIGLFDYRLTPKEEVKKEKLKLSPIVFFKGINGYVRVSKLFEESLPLNSVTLAYIASAKTKDANAEREEPFRDAITYEPFSNIKYLGDEELEQLSIDIGIELGERYGK